MKTYQDIIETIGKEATTRCIWLLHRYNNGQPLKFYKHAITDGVCTISEVLEASASDYIGFNIDSGEWRIRSGDPVPNLELSQLLSVWVPVGSFMAAFGDLVVNVVRVDGWCGAMPSWKLVGDSIQLKREKSIEYVDPIIMSLADQYRKLVVGKEKD